MEGKQLPHEWQGQWSKRERGTREGEEAVLEKGSTCKRVQWRLREPRAVNLHVPCFSNKELLTHGDGNEERERSVAVETVACDGMARWQCVHRNSKKVISKEKPIGVLLFPLMMATLVGPKRRFSIMHLHACLLSVVLLRMCGPHIILPSSEYLWTVADLGS
ncbi:unnamed protein product [Sphenostylis stenocarpa]|uniref:Uncharacterized protein n=1 Tax=Sphenostylis stenocarpa TaxID=92480 RepID=A0AA86ST71_9FABA|nr:unnamed protein product [Sphenostylis stenocarpa]